VISDRRRQIIRFLLLVIYSQLFAGMQTSLWPHLFGSVTPPAFWIMLAVYIALFRNTAEGLISLFAVSYSLSVYTSLPEGLLTLNLLSLFASARFLKSRVFVPTSAYFAGTCALAVIGFSLVLVVLSYLFEKNPVLGLHFLPLLTQAALTFLFAVPIFGFLQGTDHLLRDDIKEGWT
jgi:hypothetical protein